jgi:hypothetical protein
MKVYSILVAGTLLASTSFATQGDPLSAVRWQAKTGRSAVSAEARHENHARKVVDKEKCESKECCPKGAPASNSNQAIQNAWERAKFGRLIGPAGNQPADRLAASPSMKCCD